MSSRPDYYCENCGMVTYHCTCTYNREINTLSNYEPKKYKMLDEEKCKRCNLPYSHCNCPPIVEICIPEPDVRERHWYSVNEKLPEEGGRYWCYVEEVNDLGISHYEWNCCYFPKQGFTDNCKTMNVTHWTYLLGSPNE